MSTVEDIILRYMTFYSDIKKEPPRSKENLKRI
jgi:hypothetical protein